jgi:lysyl-tRNA synthetase class 2
MQTIRSFFTERGFLEVETPARIPANAPEEYIDPVNALPWQLQTSPEICMKRLLCRGYERIFQISRCWRADERGTRHLTEFTMLEWYRSNADYQDLMDDCNGLLTVIAADCIDDHIFRHKARKVDPNATWQRISVQEAFLRFAKVCTLTALQKGLFDELLTEAVEPGLAKFDVPVLLADYPRQLAALARIKPDNPLFAERFELYLAGVELANGFSELTDPDEQRSRFIESNQVRVSMGKQPLPLPEKFLAEMSAMPPAAGIALGVDRLVMLVTGAETIDQVVAFTPEEL